MDSEIYGYTIFDTFKKEFDKYTWEYTTAGMAYIDYETIITNGDCGDAGCIIYPNEGYSLRFTGRHQIIMKTVKDYIAMRTYIEDYFIAKEKKKRIDFQI